MVLLTIVTNSNPHTLYFDHPIEKPSYIRLLSASLYNSWYNLKKSGAISTLPDGNSSRHIRVLGQFQINKKIRSQQTQQNSTNFPFFSPQTQTFLNRQTQRNQNICVNFGE